MKNLLMIGALGLMGTVSAQNTPEAPAQPPVQDPAVLQNTAPVKSAYDECLTMAGQYTWAALGLNDDQISRVGALQARYKEMMAPKEEPKNDLKKSKSAKQKAAKKERAEVKDAGEDKMLVEKQADPSAPMTTMDTALIPDNSIAAEDATVADLDPVPAVPLSVDDELQMILTPEQMELWNKRCGSAQQTGMVQP